MGYENVVYVCTNKLSRVIYFFTKTKSFSLKLVQIMVSLKTERFVWNQNISFSLSREMCWFHEELLLILRVVLVSLGIVNDD